MTPTSNYIPPLDEEAALNWLRNAAEVETTITALAKVWGWDRSRASRILDRWEASARSRAVDAIVLLVRGCRQGKASFLEHSLRRHVAEVGVRGDRSGLRVRPRHGHRGGDGPLQGLLVFVDGVQALEHSLGRRRARDSAAGAFSPHESAASVPRRRVP